MFSWCTPIIVSRQENAFTLATVLRFYNKSFCHSLIKLFLETFHLPWEQPGSGEELVIIWEIFLHGEQVFGKAILTGDFKHARKMVGALIGFHFSE